MRLAGHIIWYLWCLQLHQYLVYSCKYYYVQRQCKWAQVSLGTVIACVYLYSN